MRLLSPQDLVEIGINISRPQRDRLIAQNKFPRPIKIGGRKLAWVASEIDAWIEQRVADRDRSAA